MNLTESMIYVFKNKSHHIFSGFLRDDSKFILKEFKNDLVDFFKTSKSTFSSLSTVGFKKILIEAKDSIIETSSILGTMPKRVVNGFKIFKDDFLNELEDLPDQKQKAIFCMKVIGSLSGFAMVALAGIRKTKGKGLTRHSVSAFFKAEIIFRLSQLLILRIFNELEQKMTNETDLENLNYFRSILTGNKTNNAEAANSPIFKDESVIIVEKLKDYIFQDFRIQNPKN